MNLDKFVEQIEGLRQQTYDLQNSVNETPQKKELLAQTFEHLNTSLEELYVAEEELRQQNEELIIARQQVELERQRYQELFDFAPDGYLITDTYGKIIEANQAASKLLLIEKDRLAGKLLVVFIPQEVRQEFRSQLRCLWEQKQLSDWETSLQNHQGNLSYCEISASIISDFEGNAIGIRWLLRDITARKLAEQKIRYFELQSFKSEEAARVKSKIFAVLSHELRTPLNTVICFSDILIRQKKNQFTKQSVNMIERININGKQLLTLINNMLDFAKLEEGTLNINLQVFNIKELVTITVKEMRYFAEKKNLKLELNINIENSRVFNDSIRIQQILTNLISNSIKFTDTGSILVELQEENKDKIIIIVKDTGIGIATTDLKLIFEAFQQIHQPVPGSQKGTGLGLAIVKELLDLIGGNITVESLVGEGSTFRVEIPRTASNEKLAVN